MYGFSIQGKIDGPIHGPIQKAPLYPKRGSRPAHQIPSQEVSHPGQIAPGPSRMVSEASEDRFIPVGLGHLSTFPMVLVFRLARWGGLDGLV